MGNVAEIQCQLLNEKRNHKTSKIHLYGLLKKHVNCSAGRDYYLQATLRSGEDFWNNPAWTEFEKEYIETCPAPSQGVFSSKQFKFNANGPKNAKDFRFGSNNNNNIFNHTVLANDAGIANPSPGRAQQHKKKRETEYKEEYKQESKTENITQNETEDTTRNATRNETSNEEESETNLDKEEESDRASTADGTDSGDDADTHDSAEDEDRYPQAQGDNSDGEESLLLGKVFGKDNQVKND